jgi:hypothetical protein
MADETDLSGGHRGMIYIRYVDHPLRSVPRGRLLVHNRFPAGDQRFRAWIQNYDSTLDECDCEWGRPAERNHWFRHRVSDKPSHGTPPAGVAPGQLAGTTPVR